MLTYCLECRENTDNEDSKFLITKDGRTSLLLYCVVYSSEKSRFI